LVLSVSLTFCIGLVGRRGAYYYCCDGIVKALLTIGIYPRVGIVFSEAAIIKVDNNMSGDGDIPPPLPANWNRCHAYNARKRRYCRQMPIPLTSAEQCSTTNSSQPRYCGNHRHLMIDIDDSLSSNEQSNEAKRQRTDEDKKKKDRGKRVPCPIDPSHFIYESSIAKHVLICPAVKLQQEIKNQEYYSEGINLGGHGRISSNSIGSETNTNDMIEIEEAKKLALAVLRVFHHVFLSSNICKNVDGSYCAPSIEQLQSITDNDIYSALEEVDLLSQVEEGISKDDKVGRLTAAIKRHNIRAGGPRHLHQIASILGHVRQNGIISSKTTSSSPLVIEMGAGRGMTGLVVAGAMGSSLKQAGSSAKVNLCIVERAGTRGKAETRIRNTEKNTYSDDDPIRLDNVNVIRVKCDLAHVDMDKAIPSQMKTESSRKVYIAKHLCGAGTDLAIKSMKSLSSPIDGCFMATCCHGLCTWSEYVGRDSFIQLFTSVGGLTSFGEKEFNLMKRWTAASVLEERKESAKPDNDNEMQEEHKDNNTEEEKGRYPNIFKVVSDMGLSCGGALLARACQRLIDYGRCEYMRNNIFNSSDSYKIELKHYVSRDITPQNALIVAARR